MRLIIYLFILISFTLSQQREAVKAIKPPVIDGILEDDWSNYVKFTNFKQRWPVLHADATVKSEVYFTYDEENIYVAAKFYQDKSTIKGTRYRRDNTELWNDDWFQFNFDPFNKGSNGFYIGLNPANALIDGKLGPNGQEDESWNGVITTATYIGDGYWSAEAKFPLYTLDFQTEDKQTWAMTFGRNYAQNQEQIWIHDIPTDDHLRLTSYAKIQDLENLHIGEPFKATPYIYGENTNNSLAATNNDKEKVGLDFKYQPNPATSIIVTANPDFAQIESDYDIINVSDSPTEFPERRPFFTTNNEFYNISPGVRTRNVNEIDLGLKFVQEIGQLKYDVTGIIEKNNDKWLMGDFIYTNSTDYKFELIGGLLDRDRTMFNTVLNGNIYALDRTLTFYTNIEVNNQVTTHMGTLSGINYRTRNLTGSFYVDAKPAGYSTSEVGYFLLSNKMYIGGNINYNWFFDDNFIRRTNLRINYDHLALHSNPSETAYFATHISSNTEINFGSALGVWYFWAQYTPDTGIKFRNRNNILSPNVYSDNISSFDLQDVGFDYWNFFLQTDAGRFISFGIQYENTPVRQSKADLFSINAVLKPIPEIRIDYTFSTINVEGSIFQPNLKQDVHQIKAEYNLTDRLNFRAIYNFNNFELPNYIDTDMGVPTGHIGYELNEPAFNITSAWEYEPGSFAYLVFNQFSNEDRVGKNPFFKNQKYNQFIIKFSKNFQF